MLVFDQIQFNLCVSLLFYSPTHQSNILVAVYLGCTSTGVGFEIL